MAQIILFAPLIGAILCGFGWRLIGERPAQILTTALVFLAAILSWVIFLTFDGDIRESAEVYDTKGEESDAYSSDIPAEFQKLERFAARKAK